MKKKKKETLSSYGLMPFVDFSVAAEEPEMTSAKKNKPLKPQQYTKVDSVVNVTIKGYVFTTRPLRGGYVPSSEPTPSWCRVPLQLNY